MSLRLFAFRVRLNPLLYHSSAQNVLKMLCLYLYTVIIGHKSCNILSILNKLTLLKVLHNYVTHNTKKSNIKTEPEIEPGTSCTQSGCVTIAPPSQLKVSIEVKPFNCFDAIGRNVNKQSQNLRARHNKQIHFFCNIFTCMNNYIWQFLVFTGVGFAA